MAKLIRMHSCRLAVFWCTYYIFVCLFVSGYESLDFHAIFSNISLFEVVISILQVT